MFYVILTSKVTVGLKVITFSLFLTCGALSASLVSNGSFFVQREKGGLVLSYVYDKIMVNDLLTDADLEVPSNIMHSLNMNVYYMCVQHRHHKLHTCSSINFILFKDSHRGNGLLEQIINVWRWSDTNLTATSKLKYNSYILPRQRYVQSLGRLVLSWIL